jgi:hypothetical protein
MDLLNRASATHPNQRMERHHALPKGLFPQFRSLRKYSWNCVEFSHGDHLLAHYFLARALPKSREMQHAFALMAGKRRIALAHLLYPGLNLSEEMRAYREHALVDIAFVQEKASQRGAEATAGSKWMHHPEHGTKRILKAGVPQHLDAGWSFGRASTKGLPSPNKGNHFSAEYRARLSGSRKNLLWVSHPTLGTRRVNPSDLKHYSDTGWSQSRAQLAGKPTWNTGIRTPEGVRQKISKAAQTNAIRWVNNGNRQKKVKGSDVQQYSAAGWLLGKCEVRRWVNDPVQLKETLVKVEDLDAYTGMGWQMGRLSKGGGDGSRLVGA